jgi:RNA recognition motif-containing protein
LFVGGLSFTTTNEGLRAAFARHGTVTAATVMTDRETGRSRGFGFVEMATEEDADRAIGAMNGANLDGRTIRVDKAMPRGTAPARPAGTPRTGGGPPRPGMPPRGPGGPRPGGGGGWSPSAPPFGDTRGRGGQGKRRDDERERRPEKKRSGKPINQRRSGDKGRRADESGYRW